MTLRVAILSRGPRLYSTRRLVEEAKALGCSVDILDPMKLSVTIGNDGRRILNEGWNVEVDAVIPRIGYSITGHGVAITRQFERMGTYVANSSNGIQNSRDKLHAAQILSSNHIPIPTTALVRDWRDVERAIQQVGGVPCVVKAPEGTQGSGVYLAHTERDASEIAWKLLEEGERVLVQEYIKESHGRDVRVLVVGGQVVASMRRRAHGREFRSNYHLGGSVEKVDLPDDYARIACKAARLLGLEVAGVDLLESSRGPLLLEVNSSPGLEGIEKASGVNVAGHIIQHVVESHTYSPVDLGQLLSNKEGHGTLSIRVRKYPELVGRKLGDLITLDDDGMVAAVSRAGAHIWNPSNDMVLREADEIVFYGELEVLHMRIRPLIKQTIDARFSAPEKPQPWEINDYSENEAAWAARRPDPQWRYRRR
ncbi:MAG: RimK family alpha-L-glutamate ligase [Candidatus Thermoplasmatota archaeon]|nr:RimK family alpha-L-glutamate ligase [Candidatus Thermoplasmatota archaeon]MED5486155.1 RimK family alpha-L-glutamate ligase [Candidatus Thermoplasmatota archaeon]